MSEGFGASDEFGRIAFDGKVVTLANGAEQAAKNRTMAIRRADRRRKIRLAPVVAENIARHVNFGLGILKLPEVATCPTCGHELDDES